MIFDWIALFACGIKNDTSLVRYNINIIFFVHFQQKTDIKLKFEQKLFSVMTKNCL